MLKNKKFEDIENMINSPVVKEDAELYSNI